MTAILLLVVGAVLLLVWRDILVTSFVGQPTASGYGGTLFASRPQAPADGAGKPVGRRAKATRV